MKKTYKIKKMKVFVKIGYIHKKKKIHFTLWYIFSQNVF